MMIPLSPTIMEVDVHFHVQLQGVCFLNLPPAEEDHMGPHGL